MKKGGAQPAGAASTTKKIGLRETLVRRFGHGHEDGDKDRQHRELADLQQQGRTLIQKMLSREPLSPAPDHDSHAVLHCSRKKAAHHEHNFKPSIESTKEPTESSAGNLQSQQPQRGESRPLDDHAKELILRCNLMRQYRAAQDVESLEVVNNIIYNEESHIVALFKDYLIYDDIKEFLDRRYTLKRARQQLKAIAEHSSQRLKPCYRLLKEYEIMDKGSERKKKVRKIKEEDCRKAGPDGSTFFRSRYMDSLAREDLQNSRSRLPEASLDCSTSSGRVDGGQIIDLLKKLNDRDKSSLKIEAPSAGAGKPYKRPALNPAATKKSSAAAAPSKKPPAARISKGRKVVLPKPSIIAALASPKTRLNPQPPSARNLPSSKEAVKEARTISTPGSRRLQGIQPRPLNSLMDTYFHEQSVSSRGGTSALGPLNRVSSDRLIRIASPKSSSGTSPAASRNVKVCCQSRTNVQRIVCSSALGKHGKKKEGRAAYDVLQTQLMRTIPALCVLAPLPQSLHNTPRNCGGVRNGLRNSQTVKRLDN